MGDRTYCSLSLHGPVPAAIVKAIDELARKNGGSDANPASGFWGFDEVNYAQLPEDLRQALKASSCAWAWRWEAGGGYGAGVEICDGAGTAEFAMADGEIVLPLRLIDDVDQIATARHCDAVLKRPLVVEG